MPSTNLAWRMKEAGVENFGKDGPDSLPLVKPKDDEVLVRVDAIGAVLLRRQTHHPGLDAIRASPAAISSKSPSLPDMRCR